MMNLASKTTIRTYSLSLASPAISECQKLLEDKLNNGGTQHE